MRLFALRRHRKGPLVKDQFGDVIYYDSKMEAKLQRDRMGGNAVVTLGPDHKKYEGDN